MLTVRSYKHITLSIYLENQPGPKTIRTVLCFEVVIAQVGLYFTSYFGKWVHFVLLQLLMTFRKVDPAACDMIWAAKGAAGSRHCFASCPPHQTQTWKPGEIRSRINKLVSSSFGLVFNLAQASCSLLAWWSVGCKSLLKGRT